MLKTAVIIGAHQEERLLGEKTVKGLTRKGFEIIRVERGISNKRRPDHPKSERMEDLYTLYYDIDQKTRDHFNLVLDLHYGFSEEAWSADVYSAETLFLNSLENTLNPSVGKGPRLPKDIRLYKIMPNAGAKTRAFDDRFPVCLSFLPEDILKGPHYHYVGLEFYLTSQKGYRADHRLSRRLILGVRACAMNCLGGPNR